MPRVRAQSFFRQQTELSRIKSDIVYKYVVAWMSVFLRGDRPIAREAAYIDLFSGPGTYEDLSRSTPLMVVEAVLKHPAFRQGVRLYFNDNRRAFTESLAQEIFSLQDIDRLKFAPYFSTADASISLIDSFSIGRDVPQFFFLDQFGWADVSPKMLTRVFQNRRCDTVFFIRTNRLIAAISNKLAEPTMLVQFGSTRLASLRTAFKDPNIDKETSVLAALRAVCEESGAPFFQAFPFRINHQDGPKHHLVFLSKNEKGLSIMKEIMGKASTVEYHGVPVVGYSEVPVTLSLFEPDPVVDLKEQILTRFAGRRQSVGDIYSQHHPTTSRFILRHYQEALRRLEAEGRVTVTPSAQMRPTRNGIVTMSESVEIVFPEALK